MQTGTQTTRETGLRLSVAPSSANKEIFIVRVDGSVDTLTADDLDNVIGALVRQNRNRLVIDLAGAQYISSAGWGIFISRLRETREGGGDLKLARMTSPVRDVYDLLELDGVLSHFDRLDMAESHFNGGNGHEKNPPGTNIRVATQSLSSEPPRQVVYASIADGLRQLISEDPFYTLGEMQKRLAQSGFPSVGRWSVLHSLWSLGLAFRHQRFRYYHRQMRGSGFSR